MSAVDAELVRDLQRQVRALEDDLRAQVERLPEVAERLRADYADARKRGRIAETWTSWLDAQATQAAVSWVLGSVFVRFCEDNDLTDRRWIAGTGDGLARAVDAQANWIKDNPRENERGWLREAFRWLRSTRAGAALLPDTDFLWWWDISADAAAALVGALRRRAGDGDLVHRFDSPDWDTRFLGDLYQDLSEAARKRYALLQTPEFVEEFILGLTLDPALDEFGVEELRMIDPTCGSGHFLLGGFRRLLDAWARHAPGLDARVRVQKALDGVYGVDVNAGATAIAKFRLMVAALRAAGARRLDSPDAPAFALHIATGDSLLRGAAQPSLPYESGDPLVTHSYGWEDVDAHPGILHPGRYQVVVGNPPYITVKDSALNAAYREHYKETCAGKYALSVPFAELFFRLANRGDQRAGYVGQITSNSFMKRSFGRKIVEGFFPGVDLTHVINSEGARIPGHNSEGTPTCILIGRNRAPLLPIVRAVQSKGKRETKEHGEFGEGPYWRSIVEHWNDPSYQNSWLNVTDCPRDELLVHPWSLAGGGAGDLKGMIKTSGAGAITARALRIGVFGIMGADEVFTATGGGIAHRTWGNALARTVIAGDQVRDFRCDSSELAFFPYSESHVLSQSSALSEAMAHLWPFRTVLGSRASFGGGTYFQAGRPWYEWHQLPEDQNAHQWTLTWAEVATHNHFALDRYRKVFKQTSPILKLPKGASESIHLKLLAVLNSSAACFWLRDAAQPKGGAADQMWARTHQFSSTVVGTVPVPSDMSPLRGGRLDHLARRMSAATPAAVCANTVAQRDTLDSARLRYRSALASMISEQEEIDWEVYGLYGVLDDALTYPGDDLPPLALGERAFEIVLARKVAAGDADTQWFTRHRSTPITEIPTHWPPAYQELVQRRINVIESHPLLHLIERPECKRRWASVPWEDMQADALRDWLLDRLEEPSLWRDDNGPRSVSVAQLTDAVRAHIDFRQVFDLYLGRPDYDLAKEVGRLVKDEAVPYLAARRYKPSGMRTRTEWERTWALQREEDRTGARLDIAVPPKYKPADFRTTSYWRARGKLDVPKERFIAYPGTERSADATAVLGWAGWDHLAQAQALARIVLDRQANDAWSGDRLAEPLAGLAELEPWLHQWHSGADPLYGGSPADFYTTFLDEQAHAAGLTRDDLRLLAAMPPS